MTAPALVLDGHSLTPSLLHAASLDRRPVGLAAGVAERMAAAATLAHEVAAGRAVYGRSTGVGANRHVEVGEDLAGHVDRLLRSHTCGAGPVRPPIEGVATMLVRLNHLAFGTGGARPEIAAGLVDALNAGCTTTVRRHNAFGVGDLSVLSELALALQGELPWLEGDEGRSFVRFEVGDPLPFINSSAPTIAIAALAAHELRAIVRAAQVVAALSFVAVGGNPEHWDELVPAQKGYPGHVRTGALLRALAGDGLIAARLQDPLGFRCITQIHGTVLDTLDALDRTITVELNHSSDNPMFTDGVALHNGNFHQLPLSLASDTTRLALNQLAQLSMARLSGMMDPRITGLAPFLADGPPGSSGAMILEYTSASAIADLRHLADPATRGSTIVSLGLEEHGSFAWTGALMLRDATEPLTAVLAAELVAAARACRLKGVRPAGPAAEALDRVLDVLDPDLGDHELISDQIAARSTLGDLAALAAEVEAGLVDG